MGVAGGRSGQELLHRQIAQYEEFEGFTREEVARIRRAFRLFRPPGVEEVSVEDVCDILDHLGYLGATTEVVESMAAQISQYSTFDFSEVVDLCERFATRERQAVQQAFETHCGDDQMLNTQRLEEALHSLGVVPLRAMIEEVLSGLRISKEKSLNLDQFLELVAMYRVTEGFRHEEVVKAQSVFRNLGQPCTRMVEPRSPLGNRRSSAPASPTPLSPTSLRTKELLFLELPVNLLREALLRMFGIHATKQLNALLERMPASDSLPEEDGGNECVFFNEYLIWARRLNNVLLAELRGIHSRYAGNGPLPVEHLMDMLSEIGFTLVPKAMAEFLEAAALEDKETFSFDDFVKLVGVVRASSGYTREEIEELSDVFHRFDHLQSGEIETLNLMDLLRFMGYTTDIDSMHEVLKEADANNNGTMDFGEFVQQLRVWNEVEIKKAKQFFVLYCDDETNELRSEDLPKPLKAMGHEHRPDIVRRALDNAGNPEALSFARFTKLVEFCRQAEAAEFRRRAGFAEGEFHIIKKLYMERKTGDDILEKGGLLWLLMDLGIPANTSATRQRIFEQIPAARAAALEAGVDDSEVGPPDAESLTLSTLPHLLRLLVREREANSLKRVGQAMQIARFSRAEVDDFREVFTEWSARDMPSQGRIVERALPPTSSGGPEIHSPRGSTRDGAQTHSVMRWPPVSPAQPASGERRPSVVKTLAAVQDDSETVLMQQVALQLLLCTIGMQLGAKQRKQLREKSIQVSGRDDAALDFVNFLHVMRWMLNSNFANIKVRAEGFSKRLQQGARGNVEGTPWNRRESF